METRRGAGGLQSHVCQWQMMRGSGATEHKQILQNVSDYILKHGDSKFTDKNNPDDKPRTRPGGLVYRKTWRAHIPIHHRGLREAGGNYDFTRVLDAIDAAGWIIERNPGEGERKPP